MSYNIRNFSLEFLQKMTREQAMEYFGYGDSINFNQLVANIIVAATALRWDETRGVREFWYNPIKAIILRLFPEVNEAEGNQKKYKQFDKILSDLAKDGIIAYKELGIVDYRTMRERYEIMDKANCWSNIILFVEKDSAYVHLLPLKGLLNITIISGGGWSKTGAAEALIANLDKSNKYEIYIVSDHDPHGYRIGEEAVEKLKVLGLPVKDYHRIGISPEQMSEEIQDSQKYPVKMNLKSAPQWCEEHGLEGPYQKRYKTAKRKGVKTKELVYEGTKCYGLEIEAVSGQPGGPRLLREIVLRELLEHLVEYDRIWEITENRWSDVPRRTIEHYLDTDTNDYWKEYPTVENLTDYYGPEDYEQIRENISNRKEEDTTGLNEDLGGAEEELYSAEASRDRTLANKYAEYQVKIERLVEEYITPIEEKRNEERDSIRERYRSDINYWEDEISDLEGQIYDIESPYNDALSGLEMDYHKSRSLFAQAHMQWLSNNIESYIEIATETEPLSFGLMKGCIKKALEDNEKLEDLIDKALYWDATRVYEYIGTDIDENGTIQMHIADILRELIKDAKSHTRARGG